MWLLMGYMRDSEQCSNWIQLDLISILVNFLCELGQIMTRYDFQEATPLPDFTFGQLFIWIGANNDQIWRPRG